MKSYSSPFGPLYLEEDFAALAKRLQEIYFSKIFILADSNTAVHCVPLIKDFIPAHEIVTIPAGEQNKTMHQCGMTWSFLIEHGADRKSMVLNVGGGMIGDLGGFVASCFQRGIRFVHIPTSVLAMTDAAIGGKLGVDFQGYKNYIGLFNRPEFTWINTVFIQTLPAVEKINGLAEMVKHAIIGSSPLWEKLNAIAAIDDISWDELLHLSIPVKINIIDMDPREEGIRKTLNFGHTIGHALESYFLKSDTPLSHGQCVTLGMLAESKMAMDAGLLTKNDFEKIYALILRILAPPSITIPTADELSQWMARDKKNFNQVLSFSLPTGIGTCKWGLTGLDPIPAMEWLGEQVSGKSFRLMSDPF
jgi:3-dehydroquinate synthase